MPKSSSATFRDSEKFAVAVRSALYGISLGVSTVTNRCGAELVVLMAVVVGFSSSEPAAVAKNVSPLAVKYYKQKIKVVKIQILSKIRVN